MPISVSGTSITFNDSTTQTTAASGIAISSGISSYNSPGTFTTPANTTRVYIALVGGGGAGGGPGANGGGSGGAGLVAAGYYPVSASTPYPITVGGQGNSPGSPNAPGNPGGASSFGSILTSNGGNGGAAGPNVQAEGQPGGAPGNTGTAPLAQVSSPALFTNSDAGVIGQVWSSTAGRGSAPAGNPGNAGRVVVYY